MRTYVSRGYVLLPNSGGAGHHRREHIVIVEHVLGHPLPAGAIVHHVNGNKAENRTDNLAALQNQTEHQELHRKLVVKRAGGNPWADRFCHWCRQPRHSSMFYVTKQGYDSYCKECRRKEARERQRANRSAACQQQAV